MDSEKWYKVLLKIRTDGAQYCPDCGKGIVDAEYREISDGDGMIIMKCPNCGALKHFSHQKPLEPIPKKLNVIGKFNTSFGLRYVIEATEFKIGDKVSIDGEYYIVESVIFPTRPTKMDRVAIAVSKAT